MGPPHQRERALAVAAVTGVLDRCWVLREGLEATDWSWLLAWLDEVGLGAIFFAEANRTGIASAVPPPVRDDLRTRAQDTAAQNAQLLTAALRTGRVLGAAGIRWMPLKGVALAITAPEYFSTRSTSDFDVLVRPADVESAADVLRRTLRPVWTFTRFSGEALSIPEADAARTHHLYQFETPEGVVVELHHALPELTSTDSEPIWDRAAPHRSGDHEVLVPPADDLLGIACLHALGHHAGEPMMLLRHLADVRVLLELGADPEVARAAYDRGGRCTVSASLRELADASEWARSGGRPRGTAARAVIDSGSSAAGPARGLLRLAWRVRTRLATDGIQAVFPPRRYLARAFGEDGWTKPLPVLWMRHWASYVARAVGR